MPQKCSFWMVPTTNQIFLESDLFYFHFEYPLTLRACVRMKRTQINIEQSPAVTHEDGSSSSCNTFIFGRKIDHKVDMLIISNMVTTNFNKF